MSTSLNIQKQKLEAMKAARKPLFELFEQNPNDRCLVPQIKSIDDQIAECTRQIERDRLSQN